MDLNLVVIIAYLVAIVVFGLFMSIYVKKADDYFVGGRAFNHWVVAGSVIGTNVAAIYLVGPAGVAYNSGVPVLMIAWTGNMLAAFSAALFVPRLRRLHITTVPDILETRYNRVVRLLPVILWLFYYAFFTGNNLYALCLCLSTVLDWPVQRLIWTVGPVVVIYSSTAGLLGAAYTDIIQTFLMVIGGVILLPLAMRQVGGVESFIAQTPPELFTFWKAGTNGINWQDLIMFTLTGFPFWCTSQYLLQRTFGGRSIKDASKGLALAAILTGPLTLCYILPGMCGRIIYSGDKALANSDQILPMLFKDIIPAGLGGIFIAALIAASYSTIAAVLNASATLFTNDIYRPARPACSSTHYTWVGRGVTVLVGLIAMFFALNVEKLGGIINANYEIMTFFEPPIFVVVCAALFWRSITNKAAIATLVGGTLVNAFCTWGLHMGPAYRSFVIFPACFAILFLVSALTRNSAKQQNRVDRFLATLSPGALDLRSTRFLAGLAISVLSLAAFVLCSVFEQRLPKPANVFVFLALVTGFVAGVLVMLPKVIGREVDSPLGENDALSKSLVNRVLSSGYLWLAVYTFAGALMFFLYYAG